MPILCWGCELWAECDWGGQPNYQFLVCGSTVSLYQQSYFCLILVSGLIHQLLKARSLLTVQSAEQTLCPCNQLPVQCLSYWSLKLTTWLGIFRFSFIRRLGELHWIQFHWMKIHRYVSQLLGFNTQICIAFLIKFPESSQLLQLFRTEIRYSIPWRGNSFSLKYDHFHSQLLR